MEYLYVCHFSNGHIKVGRSIDPKSRIAAHAERVACVGIELIEHHIAPCVGYSAPVETELIRKCAELATARHKNEWFSGVDFGDACSFADHCATQKHIFKPRSTAVTFWSFLVAQLVESGLTQVEIAKSVECGQTTISELFRGETEDPRSSVGLALISLAKKRGLSVAEVA